MNFQDFENILPKLQNISVSTGEYQVQNHKKILDIKIKDNQTPVTEIDLQSSNMIEEELNKLTPDIPVISEENQKPSKAADLFWIIDPLDGTKNYLKGNNNFCINIALIKNQNPILGIIYSPIHKLFYYSFKNHGSFKKLKNEPPIQIKTQTMPMSEKTIIYTSSSINEDICQRLKKQFDNLKIITTSSALKFGYIASGQGHFYPRLGPTHEWDTASGQSIIEEAGGVVLDKSMNSLKYNKNSQYINAEFFVLCDQSFAWDKIIKSIIS